MKKFIIERTIPGAGSLGPEDLADIAKKSSAAIRDLGKPYHWVQTYIAENKLYCIHIAPDMETILKHSALGCFPVDHVYEVQHIIDASTGGEG